MPPPLNPQQQQSLGLFTAARNQALQANNRAYAAAQKGYAQALAQSRATQGSVAKGYALSQKQLKQAQARAQLAGQQILGGYQRLGQQSLNENQNQQQAILNELAGQGGFARDNLAKQYAAAGGQAEQSLISRGLGNTTVRDSVLRGLEYDRALAAKGIDEGVSRQRADVMGRFGQQRAALLADMGRARLGYADLNAQRNFQNSQALNAIGLQRLGYLGQAGQFQAGLGSQLAGLQAQILGRNAQMPSLNEYLALTRAGGDFGGGQSPFQGGLSVAPGSGGGARPGMGSGATYGSNIGNANGQYSAYTGGGYGASGAGGTSYMYPGTTTIPQQQTPYGGPPGFAGAAGAAAAIGYEPQQYTNNPEEAAYSEEVNAFLGG